MKANYYKIFTITLLFTLVSNLSLFSSNNIKEIFANSNFKITENSEEIGIAISKNPWESFTLAIDNMEILNNPVVHFDLMSNENISLRIDLTDGHMVSSQAGIVVKEINGANSFQTISFDFTNLTHDLDLSDDVYLVFYVNPGKTYKGEITIKNLTINPEIPTQNQISTQSNGFKMFPSPATSFTNIEIPNENLSILQIIDMSGRTMVQFDISGYAGTSYRVELNNMPKGYYTVQLTDGNNKLTEKLIIN